MFKKKLLLLALLGLLFSIIPGIALADNGPEISVVEDTVTISGQDVDPGEWVTISVEREDGKRAYISQIRSDNDGCYQFCFELKEGVYQVYLSNRQEAVSCTVEEEQEGNDDNNSSPGNHSITHTAYLHIVGDDEHGVILDRYLIRWTDESYYLDEALEDIFDEQGIDYLITNDGYLKSIDGLSEKKVGYPESGWKYKVNNIVPGYGIGSQKLKDVQKIILYYALTADDRGPGWPSSAGVISNKTEQVKQISSDYQNYLKELDSHNTVLNAGKQMSPKKAEEIKKDIEENQVSEEENVGVEECGVGDHEVSLFVPAEALQNEKKITVTELNTKDAPTAFAIKMASSVYEFGPGGTTFDKPVTITIQVPITQDMDINSLTPAWYDEQKGEWIPIPAVIDLKTGLVVFKIDHFTKFAVLETAGRVSFSDVGENLVWARDAIEILAGQGIIKGTGTGTGTGFEPGRSISRAEFVQLISKALNLTVDETGEMAFSDVNVDDWFADAVKIAYCNDIVSGYPDGTFRPDAKISRNEIAMVLKRLNKAQTAEDNAEIKDMETIPEWAKDAVNWAYQERLISGYPDGSFGGGQSLTRAEAAVVVYRYLNRFGE
ncbi:MAG: S-layer homology domain-containing protein [Bacillota bacterium]|nr:S-layer homology domain-containing protein [Bacillota bacterium]